MIHSAFFWELSNLLGPQINQALSSSAWKLYRQLIHSSMLSKANWVHSQKELGRVSHSCSHSYSQPHQATPSVVLTGMLTGPLLWQFNSLHSRKSSTSLQGLFSATTLSWISSPRVSVPQTALCGCTCRQEVWRRPLWQHFWLMKLVVWLPVHVQKVHFWGERSSKSTAATCNQETTPDLPLLSAKSV